MEKRNTREEGDEHIEVVAVGASAGGIDACERMLAQLPADSCLAIVIVLHLDPRQPSHLAAVLGAKSPVPVIAVHEPTRIEVNHVYVIVPDTALEFDDGELRPSPRAVITGPLAPIDGLFVSLARVYGRRGAAVVLSGLGSDGASGLLEVHQAGGLCIAQDPATAKHDSMPRSAIETGVVDSILAPEEIVEYLLASVLDHAAMDGPMADFAETTTARVPGHDFEAILDLLAEQHGLPVHDYKPGTLQRRAERHLSRLLCASWADYRAYLQVHPEELTALYDDVLIGVTQFFRDPEQWAYLEREVVPALLDSHDIDAGPVRVWSAGCATGEEAYSLAILFLEQIAERGKKLDLHVFATDLSQSAIAFARRGEYSNQIAKHVSPSRLARFFEPRGDRFQVRTAVRELLTFARHDLLSEPPLSRMDFIACRNLLIYLEGHAQYASITRLHFALRPGGVLWLGSAESVGRQVDLFTPVSRKFRVYKTRGPRRTDASSWSARPPSSGTLSAPSALDRVLPSRSRGTGRLTRVLEQYVLEHLTAPCVVINEAGVVLHMFGATSKYLSAPRGELRVDLLSWVEDSALYAKLRTAVERAIKHHQRVTVEAEVRRGERLAFVEITIEPLASVAEGLFLVSFSDRPLPSVVKAVVPELGTDEQPLVQHLAEQLHEAEVELQATLEQLDTAHEDYRASYEELVSLNEELQSSNEELETIKEQAQSLNEELLTVNRELEDRNQLLGAVNADLENLLALTTIPTVFLDRSLQIRRFTPASERVMWLVDSDIGRPIEHIKKRVDDPTLVSDAQRVLSELMAVEAEVPAEDGRWYQRRIVPFRSGDRIEGVCLIFRDVTAQKLATEQSEELRHFAAAIVRTARAPFVVLDESLHLIAANESFFDTFGIAPPATGAGILTGDVEGLSLHELGDGEWDIAPLREQLQRIILDKTELHDFEFEHEFPTVGSRHLRINANVLERPNRTPMVLMAMDDVTPLRAAQDEALRRTYELEQEHRRKDEFLAMLGHELRNPLAALVNGLTLLEQVGDDPKERARIHPMLDRQTRRITVMLDQLLDIARVSWGKIRLDQHEIDLVEVVQAAVEAVQPTITVAHHQLHLELPKPGTVLVRGDLVRLVQVVENLLTNAVKYTEDGGEIWLSVRAVDDKAQIAVRDNGVGIEPELLSQIFEVFTQGAQSLARSKGGLGLGLPLVRQLVDMHGGRVEAHSEGRGKGSEFIVTLPRLGAAVVPECAQIEQVELGSIPPRRVLIVDDERDAAATLAELLRSKGHQTCLAHDGRQALEAVPKFAPDVVLVALELPDTDGYELAHELRARFGRPLRIVALTGYPRDNQRLTEAGFDDHVIKPPNNQRLAAALAGSSRL